MFDSFCKCNGSSREKLKNQLKSKGYTIGKPQATAMVKYIGGNRNTQSIMMRKMGKPSFKNNEGRNSVLVNDGRTLNGLNFLKFKFNI